MPRYARSELKYAIVKATEDPHLVGEVSREHPHFQWKDPSNARPKKRGIDLLFAYPPNILEIYIVRLPCAAPEHKRSA